MFLLFDLLLGVEHGVDTPAADFQDEMMAYMPPSHAKLVNEFKFRIQQLDVSIPAFVQQHDNLVASHSACVENLRRFRAFHLGVATRYLVRTDRGTGTSTFRDLLKECLHNTVSANRSVVCSAGTGA